MRAETEASVELNNLDVHMSLKGTKTGRRTACSNVIKLIVCEFCSALGDIKLFDASDVFLYVLRGFL